MSKPIPTTAVIKTEPLTKEAWMGDSFCFGSSDEMIVRLAAGALPGDTSLTVEIRHKDREAEQKSDD